VRERERERNGGVRVTDLAFMCVPETKFYGTDLFPDNGLSFVGKCKIGVQGWEVKKVSSVK
jgi:hypothetical protein